MRARSIAAALLLGVVIAPIWSTLLASPAAAHAQTVAVTPSDGQELERSPRSVRVTFDEPVSIESESDVGTVLDQSGDRVDDGTAVLSSGGRVLTVGLDGRLDEGVYIASWSVVSADTHPVGGSVQFGVGVPASTVSLSATPQPSAVLGLLVGLAKGVLYSGLVVAFGLPPALRLLGTERAERGRRRRVVLVALAVTALASVAQYLWDDSAQKTSTVSVSGLASFVVTSAYVPPVAVRLAALALAALVVAVPQLRRVDTTSVLVGVGAVTIGTVVVNGHGGSGPWWSFLTTFAHAVAAVAWIGGLVGLGWAVLRRRLGPERLRRLPLWSRYATVCVAVLVVSGTVQTLVEVRFPQALFDTRYGVVLIVKLVLVGVVLVLAVGGAGWVRRSRRSADERPAPGETARLRTRVRWEAGAAAAVLLVSGVLSSTTPAAAAWAPLRVETVRAGPYSVRVEVEPARRGPESFRVTATQQHSGDPVPESVTVDLRAVGGAVRALPVTFPYRVAGTVHPGRPTPVTFISTEVNVPSTGEWEATVTVVESDLVQYTAAVRFTVS